MIAKVRCVLSHIVPVRSSNILICISICSTKSISVFGFFCIIPFLVCILYSMLCSRAICIMLWLVWIVRVSSLALATGDGATETGILSGDGRTNMEVLRPSTETSGTTSPDAISIGEQEVSDPGNIEKHSYYLLFSLFTYPMISTGAICCERQRIMVQVRIS